MEEGSVSRILNRFDAISLHRSPSPSPSPRSPEDRPVESKGRRRVNPLLLPYPHPVELRIPAGRKKQFDAIYHYGSPSRSRRRPEDGPRWRRPADFPTWVALTITLPAHRNELYKYFCSLPLSHIKKKLLQAMGLPYEIEKPLEFHLFHKFADTRGWELDDSLDKIIRTARILFLDEVELYFVEINDRGPFSPINELESLHAVLNALKSSPVRAPFLQAMELKVVSRMKTLAQQKAESYSDTRLYAKFDPSFHKLEKWLLSNNMKTKLKIANVSEGGKGLVASEDINIGDVVLEVPLSLVIWEGLLTPELLEKFRGFWNITSTEILLLWIIKEKLNEKSDFKIFFETLPEEFKTGLNLGKDALELLDECPAMTCIRTENMNTASQFTTLQRIVESDGIVQKEHFTLQRYMQTRQLWLSNGIDALSHDGTLKRCLVPFAQFFNHSLFPHVLHCDWGASSLKFIASRPCRKGQQCYLSYGNFDRSKLFTHYGFLPKGLEYNDVIRIPNDLCNDHFGPYAPRSEWNYQMVRKEPNLPKKLVNHFKALFSEFNKPLVPADTKDEEDDEDDEDEEEAIRVLKRLFENYLHDLNGYQMSTKPTKKLKWDVQLALQYNAIERSIYESALSACNNALKKFTLPE